MKQTFEAFVHKAMVPLMGEESVSNFSTKIRAAIVDHGKTAFSLGDKDYLWVAEVYGDAVIVNIYRASGYNSSNESAYYKISYSRDSKTGKFSFGSKAVKVVRQEVYAPADGSLDGVSVTKSLNQKMSPEDFQEVSKSMWKPQSLFTGLL